MTRALRLLLCLLWLLPAAAPRAWAEPAIDGARPEAPSIPAPQPKIASGEVSTKRFRLVYTPKAEGTARSLAERIEQARDEFQQVLGRDWPGVTEIRIGVGRDEFEALALPGGHPPRWAVALAYPRHNIILLDALSMSRPDGETTLRHELSHVALGQLGPTWPHWFQEGVAMYLTGDRFSITQYTALFRAVTQKKVFDFADLSEGWPQHPNEVEIAYAQSVAFVAHLVDRHGPERLGQLLDEVRGGVPFEVAFARTFKTSLGVEQELWEKELPSRYSWTPILTGGSVVWGLAAILMLGGWFRRRRVLAAAKAEMAAQEAAEDAALRLAEAAAENAAAAHDESPPTDTAWEPWAHDDEDEDGGTVPPRRILH